MIRRPLQCAAALALVMLASGCSASERIAKSANEIRRSADLILQDAATLPEDAPQREAIVREATAIRAQVSDIHATLPGVEDQVPWWASLLKWLLIALAGGAVVWVLSATGIASAVRVAIGWLPRRKISEAEIAAAALDESRPETMREWVAARRSADREFDAAWRAVKTAGTSTGKTVA